MTNQPNQPGKLFIICGPSGAGKSTITRAVLARTDAQFSVSATTRPQTDQDTHGKDYYFITEDEFRAMIDRDEFLEYARVFDNYYGTPAAPVRKQLAAGVPVILEIDVQGALQVFEKAPDAVGIFILPPSDEELARRINDRGRDAPDVIAKRLAKAHHEIDVARSHPGFKHHIVNDDLETAIAEVIALIQPPQ